jgi:hypothetical protein
MSATPAAAQSAGDDTALVIVVDTSGSMADPDSTGAVKIEGARAALLTFLDAVEPSTRMGLRTYPDPTGSGCGQGKLVFPVDHRQPADMAARIRTLVPNGDTPTAEALTAAASDLAASGAGSGSIVLVSDGESTCGDPCEAASALAASGIAIQVFAVGLAVTDAARNQLQCIATATDGAYLDARDTSDLDRILVDLSAAEVQVALDHPTKVTSEVGGEASGFVDIAATVGVSGRVAARDVTARIRFDDNLVAVVGPVRALGNIGPSERRTTRWRFRPGLLLAGETIRFTVTVSGPNIPQASVSQGQVEVVDVEGAGDAGAVLANASDIVILGDSYSSGEGAGSYLGGTDQEGNTCHRSPSTYLVRAFEVPNDHILACSGAIVTDFWRPNAANGVESQLVQLENLVERVPGRIDVGVMTFGGNDLGFKTILLSCLFSTNPCSRRIDKTTTEDYLRRAINGTRDDPRGLVRRLADVYKTVDRVLNSAEQIAVRGHRAALLVLAYPRPLPGADRQCLELFTIDQDELDFLTGLATTFNAVVEGAVRTARAEGAAVAFVPNTEDVFLPDHTVCDREPWIRSVTSVDLGVGTLGDWIALAKAGTSDAWNAVFGRSGNAVGTAIKGEIGRRIQELFHPTGQGYDAETLAVIRWSKTVAADEVTFEAQPYVFDPPEGTVRLDDISGAPIIVLQGGSDRIDLQPQAPYRLQAAGFAPGTPVRVVLESVPTVVAATTAGDDGAIDTTFVTPSHLAAGSHTLRVVGLDRSFSPRELAAPVQVAEDEGLPWLAIVAASGIALALAGTLVRRRAGAAGGRDPHAAAGHHH